MSKGIHLVTRLQRVLNISLKLGRAAIEGKSMSDELSVQSFCK